MPALHACAASAAAAHSAVSALLKGKHSTSQEFWLQLLKVMFAMQLAAGLLSSMIT
jgi:hypothetical protein